MNNSLHRRLVLFLLTLLAGSELLAQTVYVIPLREPVEAPAARHIAKGFQAARQAKADLVVLHIDTYGGRVDHADSIRGTILDSKIPTAAFIDRNAASAGALIAIACDSIYMAAGASMGAATVVDGKTGAAAPDKYQSYWRGIMRATAEKNKRDPAIAEKMVDQKLDLPGISPAGQVITFSTNEAVKYDYCEGEVASVKDIAGKFGLSDAKIVNYGGSTVDKLINWLISPGVSGFLLILIFGGLFMEMKTPGVGFAGMIALIGIALFFAPHYIEGLAESWEIAVFFVGVVLIAVEIFVIPGFGVAGVLGIIFSVLGISVALLDNDGISFEYVSTNDVLHSTALVLVMLSTSILLVIWLARHLVTSQAAYPFVDTATQDRAQGYTAVSNDILELVGCEAVALTDLRPSGYIEIEGRKYDAEAKEGFIPKGATVIVDSVRSINLIVRPA
ncbi:MAG: NfeD family protein [Bacteroidota bacterium]